MHMFPIFMLMTTLITVLRNMKLQVLDEVDKNVKAKTQIPKEYGVPCSTLSTWLNNKDSLRRTHGYLFLQY